MKMFEFPIKISLNFVPKDPINNISARAAYRYRFFDIDTDTTFRYWYQLDYRRIYASLGLSELTTLFKISEVFWKWLDTSGYQVVHNNMGRY